MAVGVRDVGAVTCRRRVRWQTGFSRAFSVSKTCSLAEVGELLAEALEIAEDVLVDEADEAEQFEQRVLQRRGGEQELVVAGQRLLQRVGDDVRGLVDVAQPVRFVDDHRSHGTCCDVGRLVPGELVGADDDLPSASKGRKLALP